MQSRLRKMRTAVDVCPGSRTNHAMPIVKCLQALRTTVTPTWVDGKYALGLIRINEMPNNDDIENAPQPCADRK